MLFIHSFINSRGSPNFPKPHTRIRRLSQNLRQIDSLPKTYTHTHTLNSKSKSTIRVEPKFCQKKKRERKESVFLQRTSIRVSQQKPQNSTKKEKEKQEPGRVPLPWNERPMALLPPAGWRRAKEQKKLESQRERERDDKGELRPKETQESQKTPAKFC